tara:strand:- start:1595 stop:2029 length:435 start_codon:yes stop_codon:yes gene_type:complete
LATFGDEGFITLLDRKKEMIKTNGENVLSREVEDRILEISGASKDVVVGLLHPRWFEMISASVVLMGSADLSGNDVIDRYRRQLAGFKALKQTVFVDTLLRSTSRKTLKLGLSRIRTIMTVGPGPRIASGLTPVTTQYNIVILK